MSSSRTETGGAAATLVDVTMPQMGVSVAEGTVVAWRFEIGDRVQADETICEISTDKIDTEVPSPATGVLAEILVPVETTVSVGTPLARIAVSGGAAASDAGPSDAASPAADSSASAASPSTPASASPSTPASASPSTPASASASAWASSPPGSSSPTPSSAPASPSQSSASPSTPAPDAPKSGVTAGGNGAAAAEQMGSIAPAKRNGRRYSPVVQRIAAEHGVDLDAVPGTGRDGRVRKQDVLAFIESGAGAADEPPLHIESPYKPDPVPAPVPVAASGGGQLSRMRRQIGEHMKRSLEVSATCTTWIETDMARVETARRRLGVTALAFVARASIDALREFPALNSWMEGERYTQHADVNLGIAVSLGDDGLIVPVIHRAHELSVEGLAARIRDLARRARSRQLTPDEVRGGTFTITNPGQYGSIMATPIINQPQVAILDFEAVIKRPVVVTDADGNDSIAIRPMTIFGLSWDHRALDGALAAQFLASVKRRVEAVTP